MPSTDTKTVNLAEFGRLCSPPRSRQQISNLVRAGRLSTINGRIFPPVGLAEMAKLRVRVRLPAAEPEAAFAVPTAAAEASSSRGGDYQRHRAERESYAAERERIALERERRKLLPAAAVFDAVADAAGICRGTLEALPGRLAPRLMALAGDEPAMHALLTEAIEAALTGLAARLDAAAAGGSDDPS